jgi:hypothetical protein
LEVPKTLSRPARNEKNIVAALIEREIKRIHYVNERKKIRGQDRGSHEAGVQEANMIAAAAKVKTDGSSADGDSKSEDAESKEEQSYKAMEKE